MNIFDIHKISIKEAVNDGNGKTSAKMLIGVTASFLCMLLFVAITIFYFIHHEQSDVVMQLYDKIIIIFGIAAGLMGVKSISNAIISKHQPTTTTTNVTNNTVNNTTNIEEQITEDEPNNRKQKKNEVNVDDAYVIQTTPEQEEMMDP